MKKKITFCAEFNKQKNKMNFINKNELTFIKLKIKLIAVLISLAYPRILIPKVSIEKKEDLKLMDTGIQFRFPRLSSGKTIIQLIIMGLYRYQRYHCLYR